MTEQSSYIRDIIFILDESGSMSCMFDEPVQAVNNFINEQKNIPGSKLSLLTFNSKVKTIINNVPLQDVEEFKDYKPSDMTALYDAIGEAITNKQKTNDYDNVICVILTDGLENCSIKFKQKQVVDMITDMEKNHGWTFIYLGANQDVIKVGNDMGLSENSCSLYECRPGEMMKIVKTTSNFVSRERSM